MKSGGQIDADVVSVACDLVVPLGELWDCWHVYLEQNMWFCMK
jgi:hypothetical protein